MRYSEIGGQAVMEGVMMKNMDRYAVSVRKPNGKIETKVEECISFAEKHPLFQLPVFRGMANFLESMVIGMKTLNYSASFYEDEEEQTESRTEQLLEKILGEKAEKIIMGIVLVFSLAISIGLFMILPYIASEALGKLIRNEYVILFMEGIIRIAIFLGYIVLISRMEDIKRVFMYHGAEHKAINCVENGDDLTVLNVRKHSRYHKRCGTSFLFIVMLISIVLFMFLHFDSVWLRLLSRLLLVPVVAGISYEFIRLAGNSDAKIINILSKPGMFLQGLTTREPDDSMIEVAIASVEAVFDWKEYQSRLQAVKKSTKRKKVAEEMRKSGMTAPLPIVDPANAKKKSGTELASEIKKREQEYKKRADERKKYMKEMQKREDEIAKVMDEVSKRKEERQALAQAQEEMTEDELSSLDRFFDDPDGAKSDMESKPSVDEVENG